MTARPDTTSATALGPLATAIRAAVVVSDDTLELLLIAILARGHVLLEDPPGVGKTLLARTLAAALGGTFHRIQFTPDLLPADITGGTVYDPKSGEFHFRPGPIFANVVLADEINRGTPRAQSSLLEAMGEAHVSVDGETHALNESFFVVATQNPLEEHGTFPLPESQLDRFLMRLHLGQPSEAQTREILRRHEHRREPEATPVVVPLQGLQREQMRILDVTASNSLRDYIAAIAMASRRSIAVSAPASARATVALLRCGQAAAALRGSDHVLPDDIKRVAPSVLGHRLGITAVRPEDVVVELLEQVPLPDLP